MEEVIAEERWGGVKLGGKMYTQVFADDVMLMIEG